MYTKKHEETAENTMTEQRPTTIKTLHMEYTKQDFV